MFTHDFPPFNNVHIRVLIKIKENEFVLYSAVVN